MQNVLTLNLVASARTVRGAARDLIYSALQLHPSDRSTIEDMCDHEWVKSCGFLPERFDAFQLQCDACGDAPERRSGVLGVLQGLHASFCAVSGPWRQRLLSVLYVLLCVGALLWCGGSGGTAEQLLLVETE